MKSLSILSLRVMLLFFCSIPSLLAQNRSSRLPSNIPPNYLNEADFVLGPLNKSQMSTQTLYDRVFPLADLESFDGSDASPASNSDHFHQA